jgi:hypothetical protein
VEEVNMLILQQYNKGRCLLCGDKAEKEIDCFDFCDSCFQKANGKLVVCCSNERCQSSYGILEKTRDNILKVCLINSMSLGKSDSMVANAMLLLANNYDMTVFPVKYCPVCWRV